MRTKGNPIIVIPYINTDQHSPILTIMPEKVRILIAWAQYIQYNRAVQNTTEY